MHGRYLSSPTSHQEYSSLSATALPGYARDLNPATPARAEDFPAAIQYAPPETHQSSVQAAQPLQGHARQRLALPAPQQCDVPSPAGAKNDSVAQDLFPPASLLRQSNPRQIFQAKGQHIPTRICGLLNELRRPFDRLPTYRI